MGGLLSYLWPGQGQDVPDPATGLTPREKAAIRSNWELVKLNVTGNGEDLLIMFFEMFPVHQQRFSAFADSKPADLRGNKRLRAHANSVMYAVTSVVDNMDDPETLVEMLKKLGHNHYDHKIPRQGFIDLKTVILKLLSEKLGGKFTPLASEAWVKALDVINTVVFSGMEEKEKASRSP